jgi:hypothetical protein
VVLEVRDPVASPLQVKGRSAESPSDFGARLLIAVWITLWIAAAPSVDSRGTAAISQ